MRRLLIRSSAAAFVLGFMGTPVASAQQSLSLHLGGFSPRTEDARASDDVLVRNREFLAFEVTDFSGFTVGGDWLIPLNRYVDAGLGAGFYQNTVPAVSRNYVNANGSEIAADLKLRVAPFSATIRLLPLGRRTGVQPYIGAGAGVFLWRYSESGDFVASDGRTIVHGNFSDNGAEAGPVILGGVRVGMGSVDVGGEIRYQSAEGKFKLGPNGQPTEGFAGTVIDLGGFNYLFTFNVRF
jgi:hypothetical protein